VRLHLVGSEPDYHWGERGELARLHYAIDDLGLSGLILLHGELTLPQVAALLEQADVFVQSSLSEGLPNVVLEAMASGLPVVATDAGATRDAVTDGVEGFVVPLRDPSAIAAALRNLWLDPGLRERMGRAGRARVEREFSREREADAHVRLCRELLTA